MIQDIAAELRWAHSQDTDPWDSTLYIRCAEEVERLRKQLLDERALSDLLAETLHAVPPGVMIGGRRLAAANEAWDAALDAHERARRE
jgi:hypothetical protein